MALSPLSRSCTHQVFPSFCGTDVCKAFLAHILKEFKSKGITPFIDNDIERSKSIGPELIEAIRGSRIAIVLISRNYASSKWCLNELVEIMKCREELGQTVMTIFYEVDPSDVKKQLGEFGSVFDKTCAGKTEEVIEKWRQALAEVAQIAGYHSFNWENEAAMIEELAADVSNKLNNVVPSRDFDCLVGMEAHMENMKPLLCLESDEVRMIGIWGPSGIGKTTIARFLYSKHSQSFDLSVFIENIKTMYTRPACSDDYGLKLQFQQHLMSRIFNQKDIEVTHLGVAQARLQDKRVLVVLDDVDRSVQLDAMAKETSWFGSGSRIVITTQDRRLLQAPRIKDIYTVDFPTTDEALQIFCEYAFGQNSPKDGFEELASEVTRLSGDLPLGLRVMGSYFRGMCEQDWIEALPKLRTHLNSNIQSILNFSYDALDDEDKDLFLHLVFFCYEYNCIVEGCLEKSFKSVRQGLRVLTDKSLISTESGYARIHDLLVDLGREMFRKQSIRDPWQRQFLVDAEEIWEVLTGDTCRRSVLGIELNFNQIENELNISEKAFNRLPNLQFLRAVGLVFDSDCEGGIIFPRGLSYLSRKLRLLDWRYFPMRSMPSEFHTEFLVKLCMFGSKLEKLWDGIQPLRCLRFMDLSHSSYLKEVPDLSTATNLQDLRLCSCSSLVKLPTSIGDATNLVTLRLDFCRNLVELPSTIGNLHKLTELIMAGCYKVEALPTNINLKSLKKLNLNYCLSLKRYPEISTNIEVLYICRDEIKEVASSIMPHLDVLHISKFKDFPAAFASITKLHLDEETRKSPPWINRFPFLRQLTVSQKCMDYIDAEDCGSLESVDFSFLKYSYKSLDLLNFRNCFNLDEEARDLIIKTPIRRYAVLPGGKVPVYFSDRAIRDSVTVKLNERLCHTSFRAKVCILLENKGDNETCCRSTVGLTSIIYNKQNGVTVTCRPSYIDLNYAVKDHLYIFEVESEIEVTSTELVFEFKVWSYRWQVGECGVNIQLMEQGKDKDKSELYSEDGDEPDQVSEDGDELDHDSADEDESDHESVVGHHLEDHYSEDGDGWYQYIEYGDGSDHESVVGHHGSEYEDWSDQHLEEEDHYSEYEDWSDQHLEDHYGEYEDHDSEDRDELNRESEDKSESDHGSEDGDSFLFSRLRKIILSLIFCK